MSEYPEAYIRSATISRERLIVAKYDALFRHLCDSPGVAVTMNFTEIEQLVGTLPKSARAYSAWWQNEARSGHHTHAGAWLNAGREVEFVDRDRGIVRFGVASWRRGS